MHLTRKPGEDSNYKVDENLLTTMKTNSQAGYRLALLIGGLMVISLACGLLPVGEIVPDGEATRISLPTATPTPDLSVLGAFAIGEEVLITPGSYGALVPLFGGPGDRFFTSQIRSGEIVVIESVRISEDGVTWYQVDGQMGAGWLTEDNIGALDTVETEEGS